MIPIGQLGRRKIIAPVAGTRVLVYGFMLWRISDVQPGQSYTLETHLEGAMLSLEWCLEAVSDRRTRLTQRIVLSGDNAAAYAQEVEGSFGANLQGGMKKIAATIATAEARASSAG